MTLSHLDICYSICDPGWYILSLCLNVIIHLMRGWARDLLWLLALLTLHGSGRLSVMDMFEGSAVNLEDVMKEIPTLGRIAWPVVLKVFFQARDFWDGFVTRRIMSQTLFWFYFRKLVGGSVLLWKRKRALESPRPGCEIWLENSPAV